MEGAACFVESYNDTEFYIVAVLWVDAQVLPGPAFEGGAQGGLLLPLLQGKAEGGVREGKIGFLSKVAICDRCLCRGVPPGLLAVAAIKLVLSRLCVSVLLIELS